MLPPPPRRRALIPGILLLAGLLPGFLPALALAQAATPPPVSQDASPGTARGVAQGTEQSLGAARFTLPPGWSGGVQNNGTWQGRRDFVGERGRRGAALVQVSRPISHAAGSFDTVFTRLAGVIPELARERPTTRGQGVTVNNHPIRYDSRCCARRNDVTVSADTVAVDDGSATHVLALISLGLRGDDARAARADFDALVRSYRPGPGDRAFALEPAAGAGGLDGVFSHMNTGVRPNAFGGTDFFADMEVLMFDRGGLFSRSLPSGNRSLTEHCRAEPGDCGSYSLSGGGLFGGAERIEMREVGSRYGVIEVKTEPLRREGDNLRIGDTLQARVPPLPAGTRFNGTWRYFFASSGTTAFSSGSVSSERLLTLTPDGRFRRTGFTGASSTNSAGGGTTGFTTGRQRPAESGRYEASGYRLTLRGDDGVEEVLSLFRPGDEDGDKVLVINGSNYLRRDENGARR